MGHLPRDPGEYHCQISSKKLRIVPINSLNLSHSFIYSLFHGDSNEHFISIIRFSRSLRIFTRKANTFKIHAHTHTLMVYNSLSTKSIYDGIAIYSREGSKSHSKLSSRFLFLSLSLYLSLVIVIKSTQHWVSQKNKKSCIDVYIARCLRKSVFQARQCVLLKYVYSIVAYAYFVVWWINEWKMLYIIACLLAYIHK